MRKVSRLVLFFENNNNSNNIYVHLSSGKCITDMLVSIISLICDENL